jgi:hypothetical protein
VRVLNINGAHSHSSNHNVISKDISIANFFVTQEAVCKAITCVGTRLISSVVWQSFTKLLAFVGPDRGLTMWLWFVLLGINVVGSFGGSFVGFGGFSSLALCSRLIYFRVSTLIEIVCVPSARATLSFASNRRWIDNF